ncbi:MAG: DUF2017 family protein [Gaiella sp.]
MARHGITRRRGGGWSVTLSPAERAVLAGAAAQLHGLVDTDDPSLYRLFPPAHPDDPEAEAGYRQLVGAGLSEGKRAALAGLEGTAGQKTLSDEELEIWLAGLESLRLVLGTQLEVTEELDEARLDPAHPDHARLSLYHWLSWLQDEVVEAMMTGLDVAETARAEDD